jgi:hypothetical protein
MRTEQARVMVSLANGKLNWRTITYTGNYPFVPADVKNTIYSARAIANPNDTARATALKLTPEQVKRLRGLSVVITMNVSDSDKTELSASIEAYINAAQPERNQLEPKLLQLIDQIAQKSIPATRNLAVQRAAQINSIITPEMWKQDAAMGGAGGPGNPTNKPVPPSASPPAPAK